MGEKTKILILAKTYPIPSKHHKELVCTGGVLEDGTFIRLYPIDYRYRPYWEQFKKYQWIEVEIEKNLKDSRVESYRPVDGAKIKFLGEQLGTKKNWAERKKYVLAKGVQTMCGLQSLPKDTKTLGIIRPRNVLNVNATEVERDWKPRQIAFINQLEMFGPNRKPLEKIPYKFSFNFLCEDQNCIGHDMMIADWEVGQLFRRMRDEAKDEKKAVDKVKERLLNFICGADKDTHFFVGTILKYSSWIIVGAFYPKKE